MRNRSDSPNKNCTLEGCIKPLRAKGLCATHYNQTRPNRHPKVEASCDYCGTACIKEQRARRYEGRFCSIACRDKMNRDGDTCKLPEDHWARMYGATCEWVAPKTPTPPREFECQWCGTIGSSYQPEAIYCSRYCSRKTAKVKRRARERGAVGMYSWREVVSLWVTFGKACAYCATPTPLTELQADHVEPLATGGSNSLTNILPCCPQCNRDKRDLPLHAWNADRERRGLPPVHTDWDGQDKRYRHLVIGFHLAA